MTRRLITALALASSLVAPAAAQTMASPPAMPAGSGQVTVQLNAQNGSGESGTATLVQTASGLVVTLTLTPAPSSPQPAHIHKGTCATLNPAPAYPLQNVTAAASGSAGTSTTTLTTVKLSDLAPGPYAINVHKSTSDVKTYVACGDITVPAPGAMH